MFKTAGVLNGDVLEQKEGCCQTFNSQRAALFVEWCNSTMRWKVGKGKFHFASLLGDEVEPQQFFDEFTKNSCANMVEILNMLKGLEIESDVILSVQEKTPVIKQGDNTTTANPDGSVKNKDPTSESVDTINNTAIKKVDPGNQTFNNQKHDSGNQTTNSTNEASGMTDSTLSSIKNASSTDDTAINDLPLQEVFYDK